MRRLLSVVLGLSIAFVLFAGPGASSAFAIKPFLDGFYAKYIKDAEKDPKRKEFVEAVMEVRCNLCHQGRTKKERNTYGVELSKLLDKMADKDQPEKIAAAIEKVAKMKSDPKDKGSKTFGELIAVGKLPGSEVKAEGQEASGE